jgi:hypothetical protein
MVTLALYGEGGYMGAEVSRGEGSKLIMILKVRH